MEEEELDGSDASPSPRRDRLVFEPPWHLRLMGWDCSSECGYKCMGKHVELRQQRGWAMLQYHGKWPFVRVFGVQELFASLFSVANGLPHAFHLWRSRGVATPPGHYLSVWMWGYMLVGVNTWVWSAVFHARDVRWTEAADYFCALLNVFYSLWFVVLRVLGAPKARGRLAQWIPPLLGAAMAVVYLRHVSFMWFVKFDYGYNMRVALTVGVLHTLLWLAYFWRKQRRPHSRKGLVAVLLLNAALALEVRDFPPVWRLLDAHAIWHAATVPLGFLWYRFLIADIQHDMAHGEGGGDCGGSGGGSGAGGGRGNGLSTKGIKRT